MFTKNDLKPGMAVELRNGKYCLVVPTTRELALVAVTKSGNLWAETSDHMLTDNLDHGATHSDGFDVMKVYGLSHNGGLVFGKGSDQRELLWERREAKRLTVSQIERLLGYPVEIIPEG